MSNSTAYNFRDTKNGWQIELTRLEPNISNTFTLFEYTITSLDLSNPQIDQIFINYPPSLEHLNNISSYLAITYSYKNKSNKDDITMLFLADDTTEPKSSINIPSNPFNFYSIKSSKEIGLGSSYEQKKIKVTLIHDRVLPLVPMNISFKAGPTEETWTVYGHLPKAQPSQSDIEQIEVRSSTLNGIDKVILGLKLIESASLFRESLGTLVKAESKKIERLTQLCASKGELLEVNRLLLEILKRIDAIQATVHEKIQIGINLISD